MSGGCYLHTVETTSETGFWKEIVFPVVVVGLQKSIIFCGIFCSAAAMWGEHISEKWENRQKAKTLNL